MTSPPEIVLDLVDRYNHNRDRYRRPEYNETQVRREFIDPFFEALGWDVANERGVAPQYQEVVHEAALRSSEGRSAIVAPDYAFRIGPERKFFIEAKRPSIDIRNNPLPAYQLRRYAWTAKLPLSILTDFEEFAVYDCRFKPTPDDTAAKARTLFIRCDEYPERWGEIFSIFSREAVWRGDFDRYVESTRAKRGTQEVDDAFLAEIESWREALARNIAIRNPQLSVRDLNYAVHRTIDRIIFFRICEDRDIEPYGQLRNALNGGRVYENLLTLFRRADDRYNSGLFYFRKEKGRSTAPDTITPTLAIDDRILKGIIDNLYYPKSPYEFSVLGADILGNVYERFLGSVIRLTPAHRAIIEPKPEVRKAGGVYYTPNYIVDYIVEQTLNPLLKGKTPGQVSNMSILDPACGSGSFLLGAYKYLLDWHQRWYIEHPTKHARSELYPGPSGMLRLTTEEKKRILLNNIYGVDIDSQAVEVTKLSLLLEVLEGETKDSLQMVMFQERALPDLVNNIKCGNSLIGSDFFKGQQKAMFDKEEWHRINPFDWKTEFNEIMSRGGFDAVIGNPPWGARFDKPQEHYFRNNYSVATGRDIDSYAIFIEASLRYTIPNGYLGFITPDTFIRKNDRFKTRELVLKNSSIIELVETGPVFSKVRDTWCLVFILRNQIPEPEHEVRHRQISRFIVSVEDRLAKFGRGEWNREEYIPQTIWLKRTGLIVGYLCSKQEQEIITKMENQPLLGQLSDLYIISRGEEGSKFSLKEDSASDFYMIIPANVDRYSVGGGIPIDNKYLSPIKKEKLYKHPKIWIIRIQKMRWPQRLVTTVDCRRNSAGMKTLQIIVSPNDTVPDLNYLQGILSSKLVNFWCTNYLSDDMNKSYLERVPIRTIDWNDSTDVAQHNSMVALVERMLALNKELAESDKITPHQTNLIRRRIQATDREIDNLVFALYGLNDEEVRIVEREIG
jgi:predicted type IV restriction endonuclease